MSDLSVPTVPLALQPEGNFRLPAPDTGLVAEAGENMRRDLRGLNELAGAWQRVQMQKQTVLAQAQAQDAVLKLREKLKENYSLYGTTQLEDAVNGIDAYRKRVNQMVQETDTQSTRYQPLVREYVRAHAKDLQSRFLADGEAHHLGQTLALRDQTSQALVASALQDAMEHYDNPELFNADMRRYEEVFAIQQDDLGVSPGSPVYLARQREQMTEVFSPLITHDIATENFSRARRGLDRMRPLMDQAEWLKLDASLQSAIRVAADRAAARAASRKTKAEITADLLRTEQRRTEELVASPEWNAELKDPLARRALARRQAVAETMQLANGMLEDNDYDKQAANLLRNLVAEYKANNQNPTVRGFLEASPDNRILFEQLHTDFKDYNSSLEELDEFFRGDIFADKTVGKQWNIYYNTLSEGQKAEYRADNGKKFFLEFGNRMTKEDRQVSYARLMADGATPGGGGSGGPGGGGGVPDGMADQFRAELAGLYDGEFKFTGRDTTDEDLYENRTDYMMGDKAMRWLTEKAIREGWKPDSYIPQLEAAVRSPQFIMDMSAFAQQQGLDHDRAREILTEYDAPWLEDQRKFVQAALGDDIDTIKKFLAQPQEAQQRVINGWNFVQDAGGQWSSKAFDERSQAITETMGDLRTHLAETRRQYEEQTRSLIRRKAPGVMEELEAGDAPRQTAGKVYALAENTPIKRTDIAEAEENTVALTVSPAARPAMLDLTRINRLFSEIGDALEPYNLKNNVVMPALKGITEGFSKGVAALVRGIELRNAGQTYTPEEKGMSRLGENLDALLAAEYNRRADVPGDYSRPPSLTENPLRTGAYYRSRRIYNPFIRQQIERNKMAKKYFFETLNAVEKFNQEPKANFAKSQMLKAGTWSVNAAGAFDLGAVHGERLAEQKSLEARRYDYDDVRTALNALFETYNEAVRTFDNATADLTLSRICQIVGEAMEEFRDRYQEDMKESDFSYTLRTSTGVRSTDGDVPMADGMNDNE